jgi:hypothetical protein
VSGASEHQGNVQPRPAKHSVVVVGIVSYAAIELALALLMAFAPRTFFSEALGGFGAYNPHYIRDVASFQAAIGVALLVAVGRPGWRVPVLALTTIQFGLHSINHLIDIGGANPAWTGYFDFGSLAASTVLLAWLWRTAALEGRP